MATGTVTRGTTTKLFQPWKDSDFEGILVLVCISEYSSRKYSWLNDLLNCTFPDAIITNKEMCDLDFFVDEKKQDEVSEDIVKKVKNWYSKHIFTTLGGTANQGDIDNFLNICSPLFKSDKFGSKMAPIINRSSFNKAFTLYCSAKAHEDVLIYDRFVFYFNPSRVRTPNGEYVDCSDFSLYSTLETKTVAASAPIPPPPAGGGSIGSSAIQKMVTGFTDALTDNTDHMKKLFEQDMNKKAGQELLVPYNALSGKGVPQEPIDRYHAFHKLDNYIGKAAVAYYNNVLTVGKDSTGAAFQVNYQALAIPLTEQGIIIDRAGMCYRYLFYNDPKGKEAFKKEVPVFDDPTPQG